MEFSWRQHIRKHNTRYSQISTIGYRLANEQKKNHVTTPVFLQQTFLFLFFFIVWRYTTALHKKHGSGFLFLHHFLSNHSKQKDRQKKIRTHLHITRSKKNTYQQTNTVTLYSLSCAISPSLPGLTSSSGGSLIGGLGGGVGSIGIGVTLIPTSTSSAASSHLQVVGQSAGANQGVGSQASPQAPTYVNL